MHHLSEVYPNKLPPDRDFDPAEVCYLFFSDCLEDDLTSQLQDSSRTGASHLAEVRVGNIVAHRALPWATSGGGGWVDSVLSVVKGVERLHSELETYSFCELKQLAQAHIPIVDPGLCQGVASGAAVNSKARLLERGGIEPLIDALTADIGTSNLVCPHAKALVRAGIIGQNCKRETGLEGGNDAQLPTTNRGVLGSVYTSQKMLPAPHRQTVNNAVDEPVLHTEVRRTIVESGIEVILMARESCARCSDPSRCGLVIEAFRIGVNRSTKRDPWHDAQALH